MPNRHRLCSQEEIQLRTQNGHACNSEQLIARTSNSAQKKGLCLKLSGSFHLYGSFLKSPSVHLIANGTKKWTQNYFLQSITKSY